MLFLCYSSYSIDASLFQETVSTFIKQGQIHGSIKAGSFIPQRYEDQKNDAVVLNMHLLTSDVIAAVLTFFFFEDVLVRFGCVL